MSRFFIVKALNHLGFYFSLTRCATAHYGDLTLSFRWMIYPPLGQFVFQVGPLIVLFIGDFVPKNKKAQPKKLKGVE